MNMEKIGLVFAQLAKSITSSRKKQPKNNQKSAPKAPAQALLPQKSTPENAKVTAPETPKETAQEISKMTAPETAKETVTEAIPAQEIPAEMHQEAPVVVATAAPVEVPVESSEENTAEKPAEAPAEASDEPIEDDETDADTELSAEPASSKKKKAAKKADKADKSDKASKKEKLSKKERKAAALKELEAQEKERAERKLLAQQEKRRKADEKRKKYYTNRELSWMQFNERVLNEAGNPRVPLAERLTFVSIYQSNLDEFCRVRVGTLMDQMHQNENIYENKTGMSCKEQVEAIIKRVKPLETKKAIIYDQIMSELEPQGIRLMNFNRLSKDEGALVEKYFDQHIVPFLSPVIVGKQTPMPFLENQKLYVIVSLSNAKGKKRTGVVPCSSNVIKRLIDIPTRPGTFMLSEELILHFIGKLYPSYTVGDKAIIRVTRNAGIDVSEIHDEEFDYRKIMKKMIKKRGRLDAVRVELSRTIGEDMIQEIMTDLNINRDHIIQVETPLDLSFVFALQNYLREYSEDTSLFYEKLTPRLSPSLNMRESLIAQVERKDVLLSYPYESMRSFLKLLNEAAEDDSVVSIKITLYRVANQSKVVDALVEAAENGKEVIVLIELRARFDEANNIEMSRRLEEAGCQILYGLEEYKVHSKLCLITRSTGDTYSYITQVGTGNYNEKTSALYTDLCLITANQDIGREAAQLFSVLMRGEVVERTHELLVAPKCLQNRLVELIEGEMEKAREGKPAYIGVKMNSLTDKVLIDKLAEASCAGVKIELIVRGICCLIPKIPGETENITIISVVGRYLEHSRIYRFGVGDEEKIYIASADFMTRNTVRRVEVAAPIYDEDIRNRIRHIFDTLMDDDEKGKEKVADGNYVDRKLHEDRVNAQEIFYAEAYANAVQGKTAPLVD